MAAMLLGFGAQSDDDNGVWSENVFGFVPRESFERNSGFCACGLRCGRGRCRRFGGRDDGNGEREGERSEPSKSWFFPDAQMFYPTHQTNLPFGLRATVR